jgi:hypothetical protein
MKHLQKLPSLTPRHSVGASLEAIILFFVISTAWRELPILTRQLSGGSRRRKATLRYSVGFPIH